MENFKQLKSFKIKVDRTKLNNLFSTSKLKEAFFFTETKWKPSCDKIRFNVIEKCFGVLNEALKFLSNVSLFQGIYSDALKIARVTLVFRSET